MTSVQSVLWTFYAALLHERLTAGWRGRRAAIMAIIGLLLMLFGGIGVFVLGLSAILFIVGLLVSIFVFRQAAQAGEA